MTDTPFERVAADLADDERAYPGRSFALIYQDDLRTLLAGPPVSREDVARVIACPAYLAEVRDEQQTWLALHLADAIAALYRGETR